MGACLVLLLAEPGLALSANVRDFGAVGDGKNNDGPSIQRAFASCAAASPSPEDPCVVIFPEPGRYLTGSVQFLSSNTVLHIEPLAAIDGSTLASDYGLTGPLPSYPVQNGHNSNPRFQALVSASGLQNITVEGGGIINAHGRGFGENPLNNQTHGIYQRPCVLEFLDCANVLVRHVKIEDGAFYHVHPYNCSNVTVDSVVIAGVYHNADGVDPDSCTGVLISNCDILTSDDSISLKSGKGSEGLSYGVPTTDVRITGNRFRVGSGVAIGSEMSGGVRNVSVDNNVFDATGNVLRFKSCPGYGGVVEDISYINNTILLGASAVYIDMHYECSPPNASLPDPVFRDISVSNLRGDSAEAGMFKCLKGGCYDWRMTDVVFGKHILGYQPCLNIVNSTCDNCIPHPGCF